MTIYTIVIKYRYNGHEKTVSRAITEKFRAKAMFQSLVSTHRVNFQPEEIIIDDANEMRAIDSNNEDQVYIALSSAKCE